MSQHFLAINGPGKTTLINLDQVRTIEKVDGTGAVTLVFSEAHSVTLEGTAALTVLDHIGNTKQIIDPRPISA